LSKIIKKLSKKVKKNCQKFSKSCQKKVKKLSKKFLTPGKKSEKGLGAIVEKVQWCNSKKVTGKNKKNKKK
jgi:hypothetical protein